MTKVAILLISLFVGLALTNPSTQLYQDYLTRQIKKEFEDSGKFLETVSEVLADDLAKVMADQGTYKNYLVFGTLTIGEDEDSWQMMGLGGFVFDLKRSESLDLEFGNK